MNPASEVTACVVDHGLFFHVALRLARDFKKVYYVCPNDSALPTIQEVIGDGFSEVHWAESIWQVKKECDLFVFPDIGFKHEQRELKEQGYPVWGHNGGDRLEVNRGFFMKVIKEIGMPVPVFETVKGVSNLRVFLKEKEDCYIKIDKWRGDFETFHWRSWSEDEGELDDWSVRFGPFKEYIDFHVFDKIETEIEDGIDSFFTQGRFPENCIHGMELKDKFFLGTAAKMVDIPEEVRVANERIAPVLARYNYQGFFSTEVRITKEKESYFIDPTCRAGSPPSQVMMELWANAGEIISQGAQGRLVEPEFSAKFGLQGCLKIDAQNDEWSNLAWPKELRQWIKPSFCCEIDGRLVFPPNKHGLRGWLVATGDTILGAWDTFKKYTELLPDGVSVELSGMQELIDEVQSAEEKGMEFTSQPVPDPVEVLANG